MIAACAPVLAVLLGLAGLLIGSYLATIVMRWPEGRSASTGRSACDGCGQPLRWFELVPIVSALTSRMRCRRCGARIDPAHCLVEILAALIPATGALLLSFEAALAFAVFVWLLIPLGLLDWRHFWLPNRLTGLLAVVGFAGGTWLGMADDIDRVIGGVAGFTLLWTLMRGYRVLRGHDGLGAGDAKLLGAVGLWTGWAALPLLLLGAAGIGLIHYAILAAAKNVARDRPMPFGAYLCVAAIMQPLM